MEKYRLFLNIKRAVITIILLTVGLASTLYADTAIKLGYCAYNRWPKYAVGWYTKNARLIVAGEEKKKEVKQIKKFDNSILTFLYKISLNKKNGKHGAYGYSWVDKNHGGWIGKAVKDRNNHGKAKIYNNNGKRADFLNTRQTNVKREFVIQISKSGELGEASFRWSSDGGKTWAGNEISTDNSEIELIDGIKIWFSEGRYEKNGKWSFIVQDCWFLLDSLGRRMTDQYNEHSKKNVFWMDWGNPEWRKYWTDDVVEDLEQGPWDGVMADCGFVNIRKYWAPNGILQYETDEKFNSAIENFYAYAYKKINSIGKMLLPNSCEAINNWDQRLEHTHGGLNEGFVNICKWDKKNIWRSEKQWEKQISSLEKTCREGKVYFAMAHNRDLNRQDLLFSLASFLLGTNGKHGYFYNAGVKGYNFKNYKKDYEEFKDIYETPIGKPVGKKYFEDGVWKRKYEQGLIIVNPSSITKKVEISGNYTTSETCNTDTIKMGSHTGLLLMVNDFSEKEKHDTETAILF